MTEKDWAKFCMKLAEHGLETLRKCEERLPQVKCPQCQCRGKEACACCQHESWERAARRQATLEAGVPDIPDEAALALRPHSRCGYELAACRACNNGWNQIQDREYLAEGDGGDGEKRRQSKSSYAPEETTDDVEATGWVPQDALCEKKRPGLRQAPELLQSQGDEGLPAPRFRHHDSLLHGQAHQEQVLFRVISIN